MKIFADVADLEQMEVLAQDKTIDGFTTNPSLMRKAGVASYMEFAVEAIRLSTGRPISFEVIADSRDAMNIQAAIMSEWAPNIYVKIPIINTRGESMLDLINGLSDNGIKVNVTAVMTQDHAQSAAVALDTKTPSIISIFAGRVADTGHDPQPLVQSAVFSARLNTEILWASTRELLNIMQAADVGCHIITLTPDLIAKLPLLLKDPAAYSLETVQQFYKDAQGYDI